MSRFLELYRTFKIDKIGILKIRLKNVQNLKICPDNNHNNNNKAKYTILYTKLLDDETHQWYKIVNFLINQ